MGRLRNSLGVKESGPGAEPKGGNDLFTSCTDTGYIGSPAAPTCVTGSVSGGGVARS